MKMVTSTGLLDKLYNLRGEDSVILKEMDKQKDKATETKERTTNEKKELQEQIESLHKQHEELNYQGDKLIEVLSEIHPEDYSTVLGCLKIDFDPVALVEKLNKALPETVERVSLETKRAEEKLVSVEEEMNQAITEIEELGIRKDTALANQEKLNEYFDMALSGNINITRDSITSLLEQFAFTPEEQREAAKILMFPEDALFAYEENMKRKELEKAGKSISDVFQEAKSATIEETLEPITEEKSKKDEVIDALRSKGIDYLDFSAEEMDNLIENYDEETVLENLSYLKRNDIATDIFINHIELMYDKDLKNKIECLVNVGKQLMDVYLYPAILTKYSKEGLEDIIGTMRRNGLDPKDVPLMAY